VAQVSAVHGAMNLRAGHSKAGIGGLFHKCRLDGFREAGPAGAALEFILAVKERGIAANGEIDAIRVIVPIFIMKRRFGPLLPRDAILVWGQ